MERLLLVDDDPAMAAAVSAAMGRNYLVTTRRDGTGLLEVVRELQHTAILLDINLPGSNGLRLLDQLQPFVKTTPVFMVSVRGGDDENLTAFRLGAADYITKPFSLQVLRARIGRWLAGGETTGAVIELGWVRIDLQGARIDRGGRPVQLTKKEVLVLRCLLANRGAIVSRDKLIDFAWGYDYDGTARIVDNVNASLRRKLSPGTMAEDRGDGRSTDWPELAAGPASGGEAIAKGSPVAPVPAAGDETAGPIVSHRGLGYSWSPTKTTCPG